jgi:hypothetical protein
MFLFGVEKRNSVGGWNCPPAEFNILAAESHMDGGLTKRNLPIGDRFGFVPNGA